MKHAEPFVAATLLRRYKRFLADVILEDGRTLTVHTPNTGSMLGCAEPGMRVWLRNTHNVKRKYLWSWEMSETASGVLIGIDTSLSNKLVVEGIEQGVIAPLQGYESLKREVKYGEKNSRIDILLEDKQRRCYVEVKNVTAKLGASTAIFPDAVTRRGAKHLEELMHVIDLGYRGVIVFCVQRADVTRFSPADQIDPHYGQLLRRAARYGVEVLAYKVALSPCHAQVSEQISVEL